MRINPLTLNFQMVFGAIYNYFTGAQEDAVPVPIRQIDPIDDWELIESESDEKIDEPIKSPEIRQSSGKIRRRKNSKKISE